MIETAKTLSHQPVVNGPNGLPVIKCDPNAPAARMSLRQLLRLEQAAQTRDDMSRVAQTFPYKTGFPELDR